jgi:hypothetical protein
LIEDRVTHAASLPRWRREARVRRVRTVDYPPLAVRRPYLPMMPTQTQKGPETYSMSPAYLRNS